MIFFFSATASFIANCPLECFDEEGGEKDESFADAEAENDGTDGVGKIMYSFASIQVSDGFCIL